MTPFQTLLTQALDLGFSELSVAAVGRVTSYDSATGVAVVRPGVQRRVRATAQGGEDTYQTRPEVRAWVCWPGGGSFGAHAPLAAGDKVLLVFTDQDPSAFMRTGEIARPADLREHHSAHAIAIPLVRPAHAEGSALTLGHTDTPVRLTSARMEVDGSSDAAALASKLDSLIFALRSTYNPTGTGDGAALKTLVNTLFPSVTGGTGPFTGLATTGSTKIKTGG